MAQDEDRQRGVLGLHQVDVLQRVTDVHLEVLDDHPISLALTVAHWTRDTHTHTHTHTQRERDIVHLRLQATKSKLNA